MTPAPLPHPPPLPHLTPHPSLVLQENVLIGFACVGVRCPQCARRGDASSTSEPYADEALAFSKGMCFQREVEVEIEGADKNGARRPTG